MVSITVQNLDDYLEERLRDRARVNGRTMEEEVGYILRNALGEAQAPPEKLGTAIHELFKPLGGVELEIPAREPMREPPSFD